MSKEMLLEETASTEPLIPELERSLVGGAFIKHPLFYGFMHSPGVLNGLFRRKAELINSKLAERDVEGCEFFVEKPYRIQFLARLVMGDFLGWCDNNWSWLNKHDIKPRSACFARAFVSAWTASENLWQDKQIITALLRIMGDDAIPLGMTDEEYMKLADMPEDLVVWRGCTKRNKCGFSWTLDRNRAVFFARRFGEAKPIIVEGRVKKKNVLLYLAGRNEQEIVAHPRKVIAVKAEALEPKEKGQNDSLFKLLHGACGV